MRLSSPESRPTGRARLYRRRVRSSFSSVGWSRRRGRFSLLEFSLHLFRPSPDLVGAGREALPLLEVEQAQDQEQDALVLQKPGLTALMLVDEGRRLQRAG